MRLPGRVLMRGARGRDVKLLHRELDRVGMAIPYCERATSRFGPRTEDAVRALQERLNLEATGIVDAVTAEWLNRLAELAERAECDKPMIVRGRVFTRSGDPLGGLRVVAVDTDLTGETDLGAALTSSDGTYIIEYPAELLVQHGKQAADLRVHVYAEEQDRPLASAEIDYDASDDETIDIVVDDAKAPRPDEYTRIVGELIPHLRRADRSLDELQEDDARQDVSYLANKTGWDARLVAMASLANRMGEDTGIAPELYYAAFRSGLPANRDVLSLLPQATLQAVWQGALDDGVISSELAESIPTNLDAWRRAGAEYLLTGPLTAGPSTLKDVLAVSLGDNTDRAAKVAELRRDAGDDLAGFWEGIENELGRPARERLELDGKLAFLTLNNAPLMQLLHARGELQEPVDLVRRGFYQPDAWHELLGPDSGIDVPDEIEGRGITERRRNYAEQLSNELQLGYPTQVVAEMIRAEAVPLPGNGAVRDDVYQFLDEHRGLFELGIHPVEAYAQAHDLALSADTLAAVTALQRVYQISPSNQVMTALLDDNIDSAYAATQYDERQFVARFGEKMGGKQVARVAHAKAQQVHHATLSVTTSFLWDKTVPTPYVLGGQPTISADGDGSRRAIAAEVTSGASATLETLFGEMDFCACEHCRSVLSPAAYLVDLLQFVDLRRFNANGVELPASYDLENPADVLLKRRPDLQHLLLTCENTNVALPYIDLVNEILEHAVVNDIALAGFEGFNVDEDVTTTDLLANPQFVNRTAYQQLLGEIFPIELPFHQPLAALRTHFERFDVPLHQAMERLRHHEGLATPGGSPSTDYAWRDICLERLGLSRQTYNVLTDSTPSLAMFFGESPTASDDDVIDRWSNARQLSRGLGLTYEEVLDLARTRFINPRVDLLPKLERLGVNVTKLKELHDGDLTPDEFTALLPEGLDTAPYGGDIADWVTTSYDDIVELVVISDPTGSEELCRFDLLELRHALPDMTANRLRPDELLRINRFVRLQRVLGWPIDLVDRALVALYPAAQLPAAGDNDSTLIEKLDAGLAEAVVDLGVVRRVLELLDLRPEKELRRLLVTWSDMDTFGFTALYRQVFLSPATLQRDDAFADDGFGGFPRRPNDDLLGHAEALRAALNVTDADWDLLVDRLGFGEQTKLTLANISALFRHSYLARKLKLAIRELFALIELSGLKPFTAIDAADPDIVRFVELAQLIRESDLTLLELRWFAAHVDHTGKAGPKLSDILDFAVAVRTDLARIAAEHVVEDDPTGEIARAKMALVYGDDAASTFFGLLEQTTSVAVGYDHPEAELEPAITGVSERLTYDDFDKTLSFRGLMTETLRNALQAVPGTGSAFDNAVGKLHDLAQAQFAAFFEQYPDLKPLYGTYDASTLPVDQRRRALLADFLPDLELRLQRQQVHQLSAARLEADTTTTRLLLEDPTLLHATDQPGEPADLDLVGVATVGVSARYYFADDATGDPDIIEPATRANIAFRPAAEGGPELPANGVHPGQPISARWSAYLVPPDNGLYNVLVETDAASAAVGLSLDGEDVPLVEDSPGVWTNQQPIELKAGEPRLLVMVAREVSERAVLSWQRKGLAQKPVPAAQLVPADLVGHFTDTYIRLLKTLAISDALQLDAEELAHFATDPDLAINAEAWTNALPTTAPTLEATAQDVFAALVPLLRYRQLTRDLKVRNAELAQILDEPSAIIEPGQDDRTRLEVVTGWDPAFTETFLTHLGWTMADLRHLDRLLRLAEAVEVADKLGIGGKVLEVTTNDPDHGLVIQLQQALRARHEHDGWLDVIQPVSDAIREQQRDALLATVLHRLSKDDDTKHIDTADKLYEHFLIDCQMAACMRTSRVRQGIATVQHFIQRCLLNLEPQIAASSIKSDWWEWMKRYRVWEANRKVFLWPENWLEPELRDDKSPFFRELESELLQSDITEDSASIALGHYLTKLDEVARLEVCGIYVTEAEVLTPADDIVHVVARTAGAKRSYYYRAQEFSAWTAWEKVGAEIEDNPVIPVVWRGRLFLFWVGITQEVPIHQGSPVSGASAETLITSLTVGGMKGDTKVTVKASLYWTERYNGAWQPTRTSDVSHPVTLGTFDPGSFDRSKLVVASREDADGLRINLGYPGSDYPSWKLFNTHSLPLRNVDELSAIDLGFVELPVPSAGSGFFLLTRDREISVGSSTNQKLSVTYFDPYSAPSKDWFFVHEVLARAPQHQVITPRHQLANEFEAPFFLQDRRHVFDVRPVETQVSVPTYIDVGIIVTPPIIVKPKIPPIVLQRPPWWKDPKGPLIKPPPLVYDGGIRPGVVQPEVGDLFLGVGATITHASLALGTFTFNGKILGPQGSVAGRRAK
ncbi:neuraminidase-like domain-containing protein [Rhodococcus sp. NCIMB 12038]|uniref:neuraminidase-like domain-containing protein n=1 Tax=Rhodococcus sp. NCIMB 12038 TaxID=933800 RepID=UPI000B3CDC8B|nr:neuraminidase-like domain-containing protein [Rhodococcus sp. NCIMB 12038]OUS97443.1 hypothetical protein CA951_03625 [Rhodococcus sp. NCIMB 12038]